MSDAALLPAGKIPPIRLRKRLEIAREEAGLTQAGLGEALGLGRTVIGKYEQGRQHPPKAIVMAWALATGVSFEWLAGDDYTRNSAQGAVTLWYSPAPRSPRTVERLDSGALNKAQRPMPMAS